MNVPLRQPATQRVKRHAKRTAVFVVGWVIVAAGVAMLVLPGPGLAVILAGLSVLAVEFAWARRLRDKTIEKTKDAASRTKRSLKSLRR